MKIASLLPSCTEIACALGLEDDIVGISHECDFPIGIKNRPVLTNSKINASGRSDEIDKEVNNILKNSLSVYDIYEDKLKELNPDLILTQDQCEVCAVSLKDVQELVNKNICDAKILSLKPDVFIDILKDITRIGKATNKEYEAEQLLKSLNQRIDYIKDKTKDLINKPKICIIEWIDPIMVAGNWAPEMIDIAGGINIISENGKHSMKINIDEILEHQPDKIIVIPCGFKVFQTMNDMDLLTSRPEWKELNAVKNNEVYIVDGNAYLNRPSQRIVDTLEILASIIHPNLFSKNKELAFNFNDIAMQKPLNFK